MKRWRMVAVWLVAASAWLCGASFSGGAEWSGQARAQGSGEWVFDLGRVEANERLFLTQLRFEVPMRGATVRCAVPSTDGSWELRTNSTMRLSGRMVTGPAQVTLVCTADRRVSGELRVTAEGRLVSALR